MKAIFRTGLLAFDTSAPEAMTIEAQVIGLISKFRGGHDVYVPFRSPEARIVDLEIGPDETVARISRQILAVAILGLVVSLLLATSAWFLTDRSMGDFFEEARSLSNVTSVFIHSVIDKIDNIMPAPVEVEMKG